MLAGVLLCAPGAASAATSSGDTTSYTNYDISIYDIPEVGCMPRTAWSLCPADQAGPTRDAHVVLDDSEPVNHDGSLRISTPDAKDRVVLGYTFARDAAPSFGNWRTGGMWVNVRTGTAPTYQVYVTCADGYLQLTYAGPWPAAGTGWQSVDVVSGGQAPWSSRWVHNGGSTTTGPQPLATYQSTCSDGVLTGLYLTQSTSGTHLHLDDLTFNQRTLNFQVARLTRPTYAPSAPRTIRSRQRQDADFLARRTYGGTGYWGDTVGEVVGRTPARAVVVAPQGSWQNAVIAGPLAAAVQGPLLLTTRNGFDTVNSPAGFLPMRSNKKVYLVGNTHQLPVKVADEVRRLGLRVVRIGAEDPYRLSVKVARLIDQRRSSHRRRLVLTSGTSTASTFGATAAASRMHGAVLLSRGSHLPTAVRSYLGELQGASVFTVGAAATAARPGTPSSHRIVGRNRFTTAALVARRFFGSPSAVTLVPDDAPVDAALGGAYAAREHAPVLPVPADRIPANIRGYLVEHRDPMHDSAVVGNTDDVPSALFDKLRQALTPQE